MLLFPLRCDLVDTPNGAPTYRSELLKSGSQHQFPLSIGGVALTAFGALSNLLA
jgi:hypothetical protein